MKTQRPQRPALRRRLLDQKQLSLGDQKVLEDFEDPPRETIPAAPPTKAAVQPVATTTTTAAAPSSSWLLYKAELALATEISQQMANNCQRIFDNMHQVTVRFQNDFVGGPAGVGRHSTASTMAAPMSAMSWLWKTACPATSKAWTRMRRSRSAGTSAIPRPAAS